MKRYKNYDINLSNWSDSYRERDTHTILSPKKGGGSLVISTYGLTGSLKSRKSKKDKTRAGPGRVVRGGESRECLGCSGAYSRLVVSVRSRPKESKRVSNAFHLPFYHDLLRPIKKLRNNKRRDITLHFFPLTMRRSKRIAGTVSDHTRSKTRRTGGVSQEELKIWGNDFGILPSD